ncbi:MAG: hypothetical protein MJ138_02160 [Kiritimatiellae bacterium]|nr:hypothetical protein [Kiritimatiellia bacterium]
MKKLTFAMAMMAAAGASMAGVSFSYQGELKTEAGENLPIGERNKTIEFRLYESSTIGTALWGRAIDVCLDKNGLFNVELSDTVGTAVSGVDGSDLAAVLADYPGKDKPIYIGLTVRGSAGEIRPRQKLMHVPTAAFAADVSQAKRGFTIASGTFTIGSGVTISRSGDTASGIVPRGVIVMWSGAANTIPAGWALCNGGNGTPDLQDRFIVGAGRDYAVGGKGGTNEVALSLAEMPSHSHTLGYNIQTCDNDDDDDPFDGTKDLGGSGVYRSATTSSAGGENGTAKPHENRPPYYALCFIMKL